MKCVYSKCMTLAGEILLTIADGPSITSIDNSRVPIFSRIHAPGWRAMGT